jgi:hypothetical protein
VAKIPCGQTDHWTTLATVFHIPATAFDTGLFARVLGPADPDGDWQVQDPTGCMSYVELRTHEPKPGGTEREGDGDSAITHLAIRSFRAVHADARLEGAPDHAALINALEEALSEAEGELGLTVVCDMAFPGEPRWQIPILATPPDIAQSASELGRISLAGVTLQFADSSIGLVRASLESGFGSLPSTLKLMFRSAIPRDELEDLFAVVLGRAEELAGLFLDVPPTKETK